MLVKTVVQRTLCQIFFKLCLESAFISNVVSSVEVVANMFADSGYWDATDEVHSSRLRDFGRIRALVISNYSSAFGSRDQDCSNFVRPQFCAAPPD